VSVPSSAAPAARAAAASRKVRPAPVVQAVLIGAALGLYLLVLNAALLRQQDLGAYLAGADQIWRGGPLYASFLQHPFPDPTLRPAFIYPPIFALVTAPLALLPRAAASVVWLLITQASLMAALIVVIRWLRPAAWAVTMLLLATLTFYPLWIDAFQGQANLPVVLLVTVGLTGVAHGRPRFAAAFGLAAAFKLTPLLLLLWLLLDRRLREAAWMLAGFAAAGAAGALLRFDDTGVFVHQVLPALASGTAFYANQSVAGFTARITSVNPYTQPWVALPWAGALTVAIGILLLASWYWRRRPLSLAQRGVAFLPLLPLLSSVTWPHHLVILLPLIWLGIVALDRAGWPVAPTLGGVASLAMFSLLPRWPVGPAFSQPGFRLAQTMDPPVFIVANAFLLGTLTLFLLAPWLLRSR
jgi:alpha-1,2-mannosyltransferase